MKYLSAAALLVLVLWVTDFGQDPESADRSGDKTGFGAESPISLGSMGEAKPNGFITEDKKSRKPEESLREEKIKFSSIGFVINPDFDQLSPEERKSELGRMEDFVEASGVISQLNSGDVLPKSEMDEWQKLFASIAQLKSIKAQEELKKIRDELEVAEAQHKIRLESVTKSVISIVKGK